MGKRHQSTRRRHGMQVVTLCISTMMVLTLLGLVVLSVLTTRNLSDYVKENLTVTVMLGDSVTAKAGMDLKKRLQKETYVKEVAYISKEQALKEQTEAMGSDPSEFLGVNPFVATLEMHVKADYANADSLKKIAKALKRNKQQVTDVAYQEDLTENVNRNLQRVSLVLLAIAVLLIIVCYSLISNTVRLDVYSRRFSIHTMKLVGASWSFIRWPFLKRSIAVGLVSSLLACGILAGVMYGIYHYEPGMQEIVYWPELVIVALSVFAAGFIIMLLCTFLSVNKFLRMTAGELYKI